MRHHLFKESNTYDIAVLVKSSAFNKKEIYSNYVAFLEQKATCIAFDLQYVDGKTSAAIIKDYLSKLLPALDSLGIKYLYVADAAYFKVLAKVAKADVHFGYVLNCKIKGYEHIKCVLGVNHQQLIYNPALKEKLMVGIETIKKCIDGTYIPVGNEIIHSASYPEGFREAWLALEKLHQYPRLACDIEGFSLRFNEAGIGSIAFAWDQHNGIAFQVDDLQTKKPSLSMRYALRKFLEEYKGELVFHYAPYDVKSIIYSLWMRDPLDHVGMLKGLHIMCRNIHDTKIIAYLATNSTAGNQLGLKTLAQSFAGNYAKDDIKDITLIPKAELLEYNLVDALSSFWVMEKFWPVVIQDKQESIYKDIMLPSMKVLIQTELIGMPMNDEKIKEAKAVLEAKRDECLNLIMNSQEVKDVTLLVQTEAMGKANAKLKTKQHPIEKFKDMVFNPNSGPQLQRLLYEVMGLPVLDYTETRQPATGGDTILKLQAHSTSPLLKTLVEYSEAEKILNTFIPAFEEGILKWDDIRYLHGSFNLGGTVSGRLSSSSPNLQNLPSNSVYGKTIKSCFIANNDWLMCGADFAQLEARIDALLTKDPMKLAVYIDKFDSHSLAAYFYFKDQMPDIEQELQGYFDS